MMMTGRIIEALHWKERIDKQADEASHMYGGGYEAWTVKALELLLLAELARQETTPQKE